MGSSRLAKQSFGMLKIHKYSILFELYLSKKKEERRRKKKEEERRKMINKILVCLNFAKRVYF